MLSERWESLFAGAYPKSTIGEFPHPEWGDEIALLEQRIEELEDGIATWEGNYRTIARLLDEAKEALAQQEL